MHVKLYLRPRIPPLPQIAQLRRLGARAALRAVGKRGVRRWAEWGALAFLAHDRLADPAKERVHGLSAREVAGPEIPALARAFGRTATPLLDRLRNGDRCVAVFDGPRPIHYQWVSFQPTEVPEVGLWLCPAEDEAYVYDVFTAAAWRGKRVAGVGSAFLDRVLEAAGRGRKLSYIRTDNHGTKRALANGGATTELLFTLDYLRLAGRAPYYAGVYGPPLYPWPTWPARAPAPAAEVELVEAPPEPALATPQVASAM